MKAIIFTVTLLIVGCCAAVAQGSSKPQIQEIQKQDTTLIMKEGKVLQVKEGKREVINVDVLIAGTKITPKGEILFKDGTTATMQEGDIITSDGKLVRAIIKAALDLKE